MNTSFVDSGWSAYAVRIVDSAHGIVCLVSYALDWTIGVLILCRDKIFSLLKNVHTDSGAHLPYRTVGTAILSRGVKFTSPSSSAEVKYE